MVAIWLATTAFDLVSKVGKSIPGAAGSWIFKQGSDKAMGGSDSDKIRAQLEKVLAEIQEVQEAVSKLSEQLADTLLQLRSDAIKSHLSVITTLYDSVTDCLSDGLKSRAELPAEDQEQYAKRHKATLESLLIEASAEIPKTLNQIHAYLGESGDKSFLFQAAKQALDSSTDFLAYYNKMKTLVLGFWIIESKGIALLQMASDAPSVPFSGGELVIKRQEKQIQDQEDVFRKIVGPTVIELSESLWNSKRVAVSISLRKREDLQYARDWPNQVWVHFSVGMFNITYRKDNKVYQLPKSKTANLGEVPTKWFIEPRGGLDPSKPFGENHFVLVEEASGGDLCFSTSEQASKNVGAFNVWSDEARKAEDGVPDLSISTWQLKPNGVGTDAAQFSIQCSRNPPDRGFVGKYFFAWRVWGGCYTWNTLNAEDPDFFFTFAPWSNDVVVV